MLESSWVFLLQVSSLRSLHGSVYPELGQLQNELGALRDLLAAVLSEHRLEGIGMLVVVWIELSATLGIAEPLKDDRHVLFLSAKDPAILTALKWIDITVDDRKGRFQLGIGLLDELSPVVVLATSLVEHADTIGTPASQHVDIDDAGDLIELQTGDGVVHKLGRPNQPTLLRRSKKKHNGSVQAHHAFGPP